MTGLQDKEYQYSRLLNYNKMSAKSRNNMTVLARVIFIMLCAAAAAVLIINIAANYDYITAIAESAADKRLIGIKTISMPDITPSRHNFKMMSRYQNILLLGVDSNGPDTLPFSGVRSDSMIILSLDNRNKSLNLISIPRDSKVYISEGHGVQKINAAFAAGGINLARKTVEETFGIKIHNYIIINSAGVRKFIDLIGGVPVHISRNMDYDDNAAGLHIHFRKGDYNLNGAAAEGYLRYRKDWMGDIGRVQRQQKFINALIEKLKSPEILVKIPAVLKIASSYSKTDLNLYQIPQYAAFIRDLNMDKVEFASLPGSPNKKGAVSYWILDPEGTQNMIYRLVYRRNINPSGKALSAGIIYTRTKSVFAAALKEDLKNYGWNVNCTGRAAAINEPLIIGYNTSITSDLIKDLKRKIPQIADYRFIHKTSRPFCDASDIVIMTGGIE